MEYRGSQRSKAARWVSYVEKWYYSTHASCYLSFLSLILIYYITRLLPSFDAVIFSGYLKTLTRLVDYKNGGEAWTLWRDSGLSLSLSLPTHTAGSARMVVLPRVT